MSDLLTLEQVAAKLSVSIATARRMRSSGRLPPPIRVGARGIRFRLDQLETAIASNLANPGPATVA